MVSFSIGDGARLMGDLGTDESTAVIEVQAASPEKTDARAYDILLEDDEEIDEFEDDDDDEELDEEDLDEEDLDEFEDEEFDEEDDDDDDFDDSDDDAVDSVDDY